MVDYCVSHSVGLTNVTPVGNIIFCRRKEKNMRQFDTRQKPHMGILWIGSIRCISSFPQFHKLHNPSVIPYLAFSLVTVLNLTAPSTYIHVYVYIFAQRERERERKKKKERTNTSPNKKKKLESTEKMESSHLDPHLQISTIHFWVVAR